MLRIFINRPKLNYKYENELARFWVLDQTNSPIKALIKSSVSETIIKDNEINYKKDLLPLQELAMSDASSNWYNYQLKNYSLN